MQKKEIICNSGKEMWAAWANGPLPISTNIEWSNAWYNAFSRQHIVPLSMVMQSPLQHIYLFAVYHAHTADKVQCPLFPEQIQTHYCLTETVIVTSGLWTGSLSNKSVLPCSTALAVGHGVPTQFKKWKTLTFPWLCYDTFPTVTDAISTFSHSF